MQIEPKKSMLKPTLLAILILSTFFTSAHANSLENALIDGVKFLDDVPEVEWPTEGSPEGTAGQKSYFLDLGYRVLRTDHKASYRKIPFVVNS